MPDGVTLAQVRKAAEDLPLALLRLAAKHGSFTGKEAPDLVRAIAPSERVKGLSDQNIRNQADRLADHGLLKRRDRPHVRYSKTRPGIRVFEGLESMCGRASVPALGEEDEEFELEITTEHALDIAGSLLAELARISQGGERLVRVRRVD